MIRYVLDRAISAAILIALLVSTACRSCPQCPKPAPPAPVTVIAPRPHCILPILPEPIPGLGVPDPQRDGYFVPRQSWALLGGYVQGVREWIAAAAECLARP